MQESIYCRDEADLPDPPDNVEAWEQLPEDFRDVVADRFENGIEHEWQLNVARGKREHRARMLRNDRRVAPRRPEATTATEAA